MEFSEFILILEKRLQQPLPGRSAQLKMTSMARLQELMRLSIPDNARQSSVLILFYPCEGEIRLVLMLRPEYRGIHSGQISLPGGKSEETDENLIFTALREAQEEIGINAGLVQIIGQLTEMYIPPSNFLVTPVVGFQPVRPEFVKNPKEVAKIIEISMKDLINPQNRQKKKIKLSMGLSLSVPCYYIHENIIWGATAMILSELVEIIKEMLEE